MSGSGDEDWAVISSSDYEEDLVAQAKTESQAQSRDAENGLIATPDTENTLILQTSAETRSSPETKTQTALAPDAAPQPENSGFIVWLPVWARRAVAWVHSCDKTLKSQSSAAFDGMFAQKLAKQRAMHRAGAMPKTALRGRFCGAGLSVLSAVDSHKEYLLYYVFSMAVCMAAATYARGLAAALFAAGPKSGDASGATPASGSLARAGKWAGDRIEIWTGAGFSRLQILARETDRMRARAGESVWGFVSRTMYEDGPASGSAWFYRPEPTRRLILNRYAEELRSFVGSAWDRASSPELYRAAGDHCAHALHLAGDGASRMTEVLKASLAGANTLLRDSTVILSRYVHNGVQRVSEKSASLMEYVGASPVPIQGLSQEKAASGAALSVIQEKARVVQSELAAWGTSLDSMANKHYVSAKASVGATVSAANRHFEATAISAYHVWRRVVHGSTD